jgi:hypothetical protein
MTLDISQCFGRKPPEESHFGELPSIKLDHLGLRFLQKEAVDFFSSKQSRSIASRL